MPFIRTLLIAILITTNLASCTDALWQKSYYSETFKNFLITKDGQRIVILGKKYHYIFDDKSGTIKKMLSWESRSKLEMEIDGFLVNNAIDVNASVTVKSKIQKNSSVELSDHEKGFLEDLGFTKAHSNDDVLKKKINLVGTRYLPKSGVNYDKSSSFSKEYRVGIEQSSFGDKAVKIAFTPVTLATDGVLMVAGVTLMTVVITTRIVSCAAMGLKLKNCH
jgi:hypothetical protein